MLILVGDTEILVGVNHEQKRCGNVMRRVTLLDVIRSVRGQFFISVRISRFYFVSLKVCDPAIRKDKCWTRIPCSFSATRSSASAVILFKDCSTVIRSYLLSTFT